MGQFFEVRQQNLFQYVRHKAWLLATPTGQKRTRRELLGSAPIGQLPELKDEWESKILGWYSWLGECVQGINGPQPLEWTSIKGWADALKINIQPCEIATLHDMSAAFCSEFRAATEPNRSAPITSIQQVNYEAAVEQAKRMRAWAASLQKQ